MANDNEGMVWVLGILGLIFAIMLVGGDLFSISGTNATGDPVTDFKLASNGNRTVFFQASAPGTYVISMNIRQDQAGSENARVNVYLNGLKIVSGKEASNTTFSPFSFEVGVSSPGQQRLDFEFVNDFFQKGNYIGAIMGQNLLQNPTFETGTANWYGNNSQFNWDSVGQDSIGGSLFLHSFAWPDPSQWTGVTSNNFPVSAGDRIDLTGFIRADSVASGGFARAGISFFQGGAYALGSNSQSVSIPNEWTFVNASIVAPSAGTVHAWLQSSPFGQTTAHFDNFNLRTTTFLTITPDEDRNFYVGSLSIEEPASQTCSLTCGAGYALSSTECACVAVCQTFIPVDCTNNGTIIHGGVDSRGCGLPNRCSGNVETNTTTTATSAPPAGSSEFDLGAFLSENIVFVIGGLAILGVLLLARKS